MSGKSKARNLPGEFALIEKYFAPLTKGAKGAVSLRDDVATLALSNKDELVVTADTLIESVHFLKSDPPDFIARKALRVNLSDLAAKGSTPLGYLLALSVAPWINEAWVAYFAAGLAQDQKQFSIPLLGGDTTATPGQLAISITALGSVPKGKIIRRGGARVGDRVFVTGTIGDGGGGLAVLKGQGASLSRQHRNYLTARYRLPEPRVAFGKSLLGVARASVDVSDGLLADLGHIANASGVGIVIAAEKIPLSPALRAFRVHDEKLITRAAISGDDYEIAFTAPQAARSKIATLAKRAKLLVSEIGVVTQGKGILLLDSDSHELSVGKSGFRHF